MAGYRVPIICIDLRSSAAKGSASSFFALDFFQEQAHDSHIGAPSLAARAPFLFWKKLLATGC
jgi:hypothetical protein